MNGHLSAGARYEAPGPDVLTARLARLDKPGEHLWVMTAAWHVPDPERDMRPGEPFYMDAESLLGLAGVGCFKCEREYSRKLARMTCDGSRDQVMPG